MKMKLFATVAMLAAAAGTQAAEVSVNDINILQGTSSVTVPLLISPTAAGETVGAFNISFAAGVPANAIPFLSGTYAGSIWGNPGEFFGVTGTEAPGNELHNVLGAVTRTTPPLQVAANGTLVTYTLDTSGLAPGTYALNPNFTVAGVGSSGDPNVGGTPTGLTFDPGVLTVSNVVIPEPSTVALTAVFAVLGLGVAIKRRRG